MDGEEKKAVTRDGGEGDHEKDLRQKLTETEKALERAMRLLEKSQKYNEELRQQSEKLSLELHTYRNAAQNRVDAASQVDEKLIAEAFGDKPFPDWGAPNESVQTSEGTGEKVVSIAESLKAAAEEVVWEQSGFVYDSASGLYYDYNSGYYYDSVRSLYYDPTSMAYFYYDEGEQTYKFHSYASGQSGEEISQTAEQGAADTVSTESNSVSSQHNQQKSCSASEKPHKHKHKEKPKIKRGRIRKARRRTKSRERKSQRGSKNQETGKNRIVSGTSENGVAVDESLEEGENEEKGERKDVGDKEAAMDYDSSDSLATGESEMESEPESGELTDESSSSSASSDDDEATGIGADPVHYDPSAGMEPEISANYPPCIRMVVRASDAVAVGTFFLVTCPGGTVGRDGDSRHVVQIPDVNISKVHAEIKYDEDNSCYTVEDLGSQNGTFINDLRISESKEKSPAIPLSHGDILRVAGTHLLLHIHPGTDTCDDCEPGQVLAALKAQQTVFNDHVVLTKAEKKKQARQQMKEIKKKYGLENSAYVDNMAAIKNPDYADKAEVRRRFIGSEHPSHQQSREPPASVHRPISSENKGHRMLAKMGWKEGSGLGKDSAGRAEPVTVELRAQQSAGLGSTSSVSVSLDNVQSAARLRRLAQAQERYHRLENTASQPDTRERGRFAGDKSACSQLSGNTVGSCDSQGGGGGVGGSGDHRPKKGSNRMEIKWIQGQTQKAT
ncbi:uncharacterized protein LOC143296985 isoform X1 [Babylonia areolata]|uniref:uncharacterized protein LOC143296985 isoform X1 n=1 Tax=Babylonia areolata TaxID=304850 RepID=UPI003FD3D295